jgi:hypothetical protein
LLKGTSRFVTLGALWLRIGYFDFCGGLKNYSLIEKLP